jgi:energy-coupling factor transporter transmembrane protein EcfT
MAELTAFSYRPGSTFLHLLDMRCKLVCMLSYSLAILAAGPRGLLFACMMLTWILSICRISVGSIFSELRYFIVLLLFIILLRTLTSPGNAVLVIGFFKATGAGLADGLLMAWRLISIVLLGLVFVATSRPSEIRTGAAWFLKPVPFIPEQRVATMIGLLVRFVPLIFGQVRSTGEALRARGIEQRKNPLYRLRYLAMPLLWRTFDHADKLVDAMTARCYNENRTTGQLVFGRREWITAIVSAGLIPFLAVL